MSLVARDLYDAGLNTDGVAGFLDQVASGRLRLEVLWPEHLTGKRVDDYREGSQLARFWLSMRKGYASSRRSARARDFREDGATSNLLPRGADRRREQLYCLGEVMRLRTKKTATEADGLCSKV